MTNDLCCIVNPDYHCLMCVEPFCTEHVRLRDVGPHAGVPFCVPCFKEHYVPYTSAPFVERMDLSDKIWNMRQAKDPNYAV